MSDSFTKGRGLKSTVSGKAARNDVTGALIKTGPVTDAYRDNYDRIFGRPSTDDKPVGKPTPYIPCAQCGNAEDCPHV